MRYLGGEALIARC